MRLVLARIVVRVAAVGTTVVAVAATVAAVVVVTAVAVVAAVVATAIAASGARAEMIANRAGKKQTVKRAKGERAKGRLFPLPLPLYPFHHSYFLASGVIFSFSRSLPRITSISYSWPAFISPSA